MHTSTFTIPGRLAPAVVVLAGAAVVALAGHTPQAAPPRAPVGSAADHHEAVTSRGDHAMGFSHQTTTHHFRLFKTGGTIEVLANDPADSATRDEIRIHLSHIVKLFSAGDFNIPMFIHDTLPPGAPTMSKRRELINYRYHETDRGALIHITTSDAQALQAIHAFLRFQISDHQTGDSTEISK